MIQVVNTTALREPAPLHPARPHGKIIVSSAPMDFDIFDAIWKGVLIGLFMAISVGPTIFAVIRYSMDQSYKAALAFVFGVSVSDTLYVVIANVAASWLVMLGTYNTYIAYVGGAVLAVVGLVGLLKKPAPAAEVKQIPTITGAHYLRIFTSGFLINTINPGVIISWLAAVTASASQPGGYRFILFGVCLLLILGIDFLKVFLAEKLRVVLTPRLIVYLQKISSGILMLLGLMLIIKTMMGS
ncbi:MAG: LysE family transporter [Taibaiella sp.]|nr:LysE family transporter [Taibaiella sp.]